MYNRFISIDPASTLTGWAVFANDGMLVAWGLIDSRNVQYSFRPQYIINELISLIHRFDFQEIALESAPRFKGTRPAALEMVVNSIKAWARGLGLRVAAYNVAAWKKSVIGDYLADKEAVQRNIYLRFPRLPQDLTEHEADAMAIGVHHAGVRHWESMSEGGPK